jgi:hypothetical protein
VGIDTGLDMGMGSGCGVIFSFQTPILLPYQLPNLNPFSFLLFRASNLLFSASEFSFYLSFNVFPFNCLLLFKFAL